MQNQIKNQIQEQLTAGLRMRDAAAKIGISEAKALCAHIQNQTNGQIKTSPLVQSPPQWIEILKSLEPCGELMALTRNEYAVHEKTGVYTKISGSAKMGIALGKDIDLRLFLQNWFAGYFVEDSDSKASKYSLQFFNKAGDAIHKIFSTSQTDISQLKKVVDNFVDKDVNSQESIPELLAKFDNSPVEKQYLNIDKVDAKGLLQDWGKLEDTHDFFGLLTAYKVRRTDALKLAEGAFTKKLANDVVSRLLYQAAEKQTPIMCFVGSGGCTQIHTGAVSKIVPLERAGQKWINVLDKSFNLHLREDEVKQAWLVEKPTAQGVVTSIEVFDKNGGDIAMFFGERKPDVPELISWRELANNL